MEKPQERPSPLPLAYTVAEAAAVLRVGKVTIYRLLRESRLSRCKIGRRTVIPVKDVAALIERLANGEGGI